MTDSSSCASANAAVAYVDGLTSRAASCLSTPSLMFARALKRPQFTDAAAAMPFSSHPALYTAA